MLRCTVNAAPNSFKVERDSLGYILYHLGAEVQVHVYTRTAPRLARRMPVKVPPDMSMYLLSPIPGLLRSVAVSEGQSLESGAELCVVEAMKMENILRATRPVKIANLRARPGDILTVRQVIPEYESGVQEGLESPGPPTSCRRSRDSGAKPESGRSARKDTKSRSAS